MTGAPALNTDRELFRESTGETAGDYYENSVHVTIDGRIGMNVGGRVIVLPIAKWHELAWPDDTSPPSPHIMRRAIYRELDITEET